ncbi:MAG: 30S ribosomal protein S12 methylthiotransferase RimO, partial [Gemmataceae bacterium]|nr:30S ribosomal protein S12 methylthiotransferase RimO [Gemmataceae bacterium]
MARFSLPVDTAASFATSRSAPAPRPRRTAPSFAFISLGCPKNTVDSEQMLAELAQNGFRLHAQPDRVDAVLINTCGFIEAAQQESLQVIREMLERKRQGQVSAVVVLGCLPQRLGNQLTQELPDIDLCLGTDALAQLTPALLRLLEQRNLFRPASVRLATSPVAGPPARLRITPRHYAYLKISEGCDRTCTFCAIPAIRGAMRSFPIEQVLEEARLLAHDGARELILVAQDLTAYGLDRDGLPRLARLLRQLDQLDAPFHWVRLLYAFPEHITDELLDILATSRKIVPYLDMPLQHVQPHILKRMGRPWHRDRLEQLLYRLRQRWPGVVLRTTFIVGFPGETDRDFEELCQFVEAARFDRLGVFSYSDEET